MAAQRAHATSLSRQLEEVSAQLERAAQATEATTLLEVATERETTLLDSRERVKHVSNMPGTHSRIRPSAV